MGGVPWMAVPGVTLTVSLFVSLVWMPVATITGLGLIMVRIAVGLHTRTPPRPLNRTVSGNTNSNSTLLLVHGWPDNKELWSHQVAALGKDHRVVCVDLPNFGSEPLEPWGVSFDDLVDLIADALRADLTETGQKGATMIVHDWGAITGGQLQRRYPELVNRMIVLDVAWTGSMKLKHLPALIIMGIFYQYWLVAAFVVAAGIPVVGRPIGDAMTKYMLKLMSGLPSTSTTKRNTPLTAMFNYPYLYFQLEEFLVMIGVWPDFNKKHNIRPEQPMWWIAVPCLFLFGDDKGFKFHPPFLEKALKGREGSHVVPLKKGDNGCPKTVGHWVQVTASSRVTQEILDWLKD